LSRDSRASMNSTLKWLWDMISMSSNDEIKVPGTFKEQVLEVKSVLSSDISGVVNSILDFAINSATVDFTVESNNENLTSFINEWFSKINYSLIGKVPVGIKALSKENYKERWKNSSLLLLRSQWNDIEIGGSTFNLPTKMWFIDGINIRVEDGEESRIIGEEKYYLKINNQEKDDKLLPATDNELIFVQKPYENWSSLYPIPFLIRRGLYRNLKNYDLINKKSEKIVSKALEYLLLLKKGSENLALKNLPEFIYNAKDLQEVKDKLKEVVLDMKTSQGTPFYVTNFDTTMEHLIPEYKRILDQSLYTNVEKRILSGLGLIEIIEGTSSSRREAILNPRPFIKEVESGVNDFISLLEDVMKVIIDRNIKKHPKLFGENANIQLHYSPIKDFINDSIRDHLRSMYDRGVLSKETYGEVVGGVDLDIEVKRRKSETKEDLDEIMYAPVIQNTENKPADITPFKKSDSIPVKKQGPEAKNFQGGIEGEPYDGTDTEFLESLEEFSKVFEEAPYKKNTDLPPSVKKYSSHAQTIFRNAFNSALEHYKNEQTAFKVAWAALKAYIFKEK